MGTYVFVQCKWGTYLIIIFWHICKFIIFFHFKQCNRYLSNVQWYVSSIRACIMHCGHGAWRAQRYVAFCLNARAGVKVMTTSWTKESSFYKIKPLLIGLLQRKVYHRVCKSVIYSNEKNEPHLFPYSRFVVHFIACYGYNVDRWSFPPKDGVSRQKTRPNGVYPNTPLISFASFQLTAFLV